LATDSTSTSAGDHPMHPRIVEILAYLARVRAELASVIESTPPERLSAPRADGAWTGGQIIYHMGSAEGSIAKLLEGLVAKALAEGALPPDTATSSRLDSLDAFHVPDRARQRIEAPERLRPPADVNVASAWESLQKVRERTLLAVASADGRDLSRVSYPHPFFGPLDGYQWVLFVGKHEERHLDQLREVLALP
jgi:hypothetical protein